MDVLELRRWCLAVGMSLETFVGRLEVALREDEYPRATNNG